MRLRRLELGAFGAFRETRLDLPDGPAVVVGPNEAGKSTLFSALVTLLYGFHPANQRDFPYMPRAGGAVPDVAADIVLDDGTEGQVHRRLLSAPAGEWQAAGSQERLNNRPLPFAAHVDRMLYRSLYALTIDDLRRMAGDAFAEVEQRLLGELGHPWQRPAREVAGELEEAAKAQWRPDRRGKTRYQALRGERDELHRQLREAQKRQESLHAEQAERYRLGERLATVEARRTDLRRRIEQSEDLGHLKRELERLDRLAADMGDPEAVRALGGDPRPEARSLAQEAAALAQRRREWAEAVARQRARRDAVTDNDHVLLADSEVPGITAVAAQVDEAGEGLARYTQAEETARRELDEAAEALLVEPWRDALGERLEALAPADLRERAEEAAQAREEAANAETRLEALPPSPNRPRLPLPYVAVPLVGAVGLAAGAWVWPGLIWGAVPLALVGGGAGVWNLYMARLQRADASAEVERRRPLEAKRDEAVQARDETVARVGHLLAGLPLPEASLRRPTPELAQRVERLRSAWRRLQQARDERRAAEQDWQGRWAAVTDILRHHGAEPAAEGEPLQPAAAALEERLQAARRRAEAAEEARQALAELARKRRGLREEARDLAARRADLTARIERVVPEAESEPERLERAAERAELRARWQDGWRALREHYPVDEDLRGRVAEAGEAILTGADLEQAREALEELEQERGDLRDEIARLDTDLEKGATEQEAGLLQGQIREVEAAMAAAAREHDRLRVAARLVREADRRFREQHQPDVLRRAGAYLARVTDGRYGQLLMGEEADAGHLRVRDSEGELVDVDAEGALSRGTRDQIFFALRLAVADHLDAGQERLPLILDELFVHWDPERMAAGVRGLGAMADQRQMILFTCHPDLAARMGELLGTEPVRLPGPEV